MPAPTESSSGSANPPLPPPPAPRGRTFPCPRGTRSTAFPAAAPPNTIPPRGTPRLPVQPAALRFRAPSPLLCEPLHRANQLIRSERLRHISIRALLLAPVTVARRRSRSHQDHRNFRIRILALQLAACLESVS